jgi:hypothetical protein
MNKFLGKSFDSVLWSLRQDWEHKAVHPSVSLDTWRHILGVLDVPHPLYSVLYLIVGGEARPMALGEPLSGTFDHAYCTLILDLLMAFSASRHDSPVNPRHRELQIPTPQLIAGNWV